MGVKPSLWFVCFVTHEGKRSSLQLRLLLAAEATNLFLKKNLGSVSLSQALALNKTQLQSFQPHFQMIERGFLEHPKAGFLHVHNLELED